LGEESVLPFENEFLNLSDEITSHVKVNIDRSVLSTNSFVSSAQAAQHTIQEYIIFLQVCCPESRSRGQSIRQRGHGMPGIPSHRPRLD
jgi:hypothetical protein